MSEAGRPPHEPTEESRLMVSEMTSYGTTQDIIAKCLNISVDTLSRHYRAEIDTSTALLVRRVANKLMDKVNDGDAAAQMFVLKTRGKWREQDKDNKEGGESALEKALNKIPDAVKL